MNAVFNAWVILVTLVIAGMVALQVYTWSGGSDMAVVGVMVVLSATYGYAFRDQFGQ